MRLCDIKGCSNKHLARGLCNKHYRAKRRADKHLSLGPVPAWSQEDLAFAKYLLEDGASYREVSWTTGIPRTTLREKLPGMGWTYEEGKQFMSWLSSDDRLLALYNELNGTRWTQ